MKMRQIRNFVFLLQSSVIAAAVRETEVFIDSISVTASKGRILWYCYRIGPFPHIVPSARVPHPEIRKRQTSPAPSRPQGNEHHGQLETPIVADKVCRLAIITRTKVMLASTKL